MAERAFDMERFLSNVDKPATAAQVVRNRVHFYPPIDTRIVQDAKYPPYDHRRHRCRMQTNSLYHTVHLK